MDIAITYFHLLTIVVLAGALIIENIAISNSLTREDLHNLLKVDAAYGISAILVASAGIALWLWVGKPSEFYSANPIFHAKITLFVCVALLSIYPTTFFLRHRHSEQDAIAVPKSVIRVLRTELLLLAIIPLLAFLMARGVGL